MKNKIIAAIIVAVFLAALVPMNITSTSASTTIEGPIKGLKHLKAGNYSFLSGDDIPGYDASSFLEAAVPLGAQAYPHPHSPWTVIALDDYYGGFYYQNFSLVLSGTHCNIWVGLNDTNWSGYQDEWRTNGPGFADDEFFFAYPWTWEAHIVTPRYLDGYRDYITGAQLEQIMDEFDNHIWQTDTSFFGQYADRPGPLNDYKIQILIFNIRDELFYSPLTALGFIEGYFWSYASDLNNANIIHVDTWQWYRRQGPTPNGGLGVPYFNQAMIYSPSQRRPYEYEGTFAHEFQHLIHHDVDPDEYSWVNEGCSTLAEYINGYGATSNLLYYMAYFWDTSLVVWEGSLENYGCVFLWTLYMYEHYGGQQFIWDLVHEQANGIQGYNNVLAAHHITKTFDQIFQDWAIANYLDDTSFANGIYGYYGLDLPCAASGWWDIPYSLWYWGFQEHAYPVDWTFYERLPYTVQYDEFYDGAPSLKVNFDGDEYAGIFPHSPTHEWHSDGTAYLWFRLGKTFAIPSAGATLKFWSNYDIEQNWDYGYVEVHDLSTDQWYTLPGVKTVLTLPNPEDNPNCPDNFEPTAYVAAGRWNAFTGNSGGWYQEQMDLTSFAGHSIDLYFTYWTDPYTLGRGWYVDDIEIPEIGFSDNVESGVNGWTVNAGWYITTGVIPNNWEVNFIKTVNLAIGGGKTVHSIVPMTLNSTLEGFKVLPAMVVPHSAVTFGPHVMVVANQPGFENSYDTYFEFLAETVPLPP